MPSARVSRGLLLAIPVMTILLLSALRFLRVTGTLTFWEYALALVSGVLMITVFVVSEGLKLAPTGFATSSEKSFSIPEPFEGVCGMIPKVVSKNHWKLQEADMKKGHFKAKIGMSLHTFSSTFLIDLKPTDERSVNIHLFCGTRSSNDPGHNDRMIAKFFSGLENGLKETKGPR